MNVSPDDQPSVSVVIPFFRRQEVFAETLASVRAQTFKPREIIVVDDASGGNALQYLSTLGEDVKVVSCLRNGGVATARNIGVAVASSDLIAFIDSDDLWHPEKLEKQLRYLKQHPDCDIVHCGCAKFQAGKEDVLYIDKPPRLTVTDMINGNHVMFQSAMIPRAVMLKTAGFDQRFREVEDWEFAFRLVAHGHKVDFIPEPLVRIRRDGNDHLSTNWYRCLKAHARIVWLNRESFQKHIGPFGTWMHLTRYLGEAGAKCGGIPGIFMRLVARVLYPFRQAA